MWTKAEFAKRKLRIQKYPGPKFLPYFLFSGLPLVILEFVPHGDLLGYLRKSNGENDDFYDLKSKEVPPRIPERQLYQFSADIARGMEFISAHQVC